MGLGRLVKWATGGRVDPTKLTLKDVAPVLLTIAIIVQPELAISVGESLGFSGAAAAAAGAATIQTGAALALGASPDQAIQSGAIAGVTAGVGGGVAVKTGSNVIGGVAGSAAGTLVAGGSSKDILTNAIAGGVANGIADSGYASAGKAAGTLIATGGDTNAAIKAAVTTELIQAGQQGYRDYSATKTAELDKFNSGINVAQADTGTTTDVDFPPVQVSGFPIFADSPRAANVKPPFGYEVMPIEMADNKPDGSYLDYTQNAWLTPNTEVQKLQTTLANPIQTPATVTGAPSVGTKTTPQPLTSTVVSTKSGIPSAPSTATGTGGTAVAPSTQSGVGGLVATGTGGTTVAPSRDKQMVDLIASEKTGDSGFKVNVDGFPKQPETSTVTPIANETETLASTETQTEIPAEGKVTEKPGASKTPSPITYTGVTPLSRTLGTSFGGYGSTTGITTGLAGERGAGEIEGKETGKERQNVWNEASLRLKDALGV